MKLIPGIRGSWRRSRPDATPAQDDKLFGHTGPELVDMLIKDVHHGQSLRIELAESMRIAMKGDHVVADAVAAHEKFDMERAHRISRTWPGGEADAELSLQEIRELAQIFGLWNETNSIIDSDIRSFIDRIRVLATETADAQFPVPAELLAALSVPISRYGIPAPALATRWEAATDTVHLFHAFYSGKASAGI